jgi:hypothetical protein
VVCLIFSNASEIETFSNCKDHEAFSSTSARNALGLLRTTHTITDHKMKSVLDFIGTSLALRGQNPLAKENELFHPAKDLTGLERDLYLNEGILSHSPS